MTKRKSDSKNLPPDDSSQAKDTSAQSNLGPEDSQVLQQFPWLKKLKSDSAAGEESKPSEVNDSESKSDEPQETANKSSKGDSKKKKRGGAQKKEPTGSSDAAGSATSQKQKQRKSNKKGKQGASQVEPGSADTASSPQSSVETDEQTNGAQTNAAPEIAKPPIESEMTIEAPPENPEPPRERVVKTTLMEAYVSSLMEGDDGGQVDPTPQVQPTSESTPEQNRTVAKTILETDISKFQQSDSVDSNVAPVVVPESAPPPANRVAKTMMEMDISKFVDNPQTPAQDAALQLPQPSENAPPEQSRIVAKTLLETDLSKFMDNPTTTPVDAYVAPEAVPESPPAPTIRVAKTMLEMDISKFVDTSQTAVPDAPPAVEQPSENAPAPQQQRKVAKTLLETDISKFADIGLATNAPTNQSIENKSTSENRVVPKTLLETDISKFMDSPQPEPTVSAQPEQIAPVPQLPPTRTVAKTFLETDISKFTEAPQATGQYSDGFGNSSVPMESQYPQGLSKADSPSFADVEIPPQVNLVQRNDNVVSPEANQYPQAESNYQYEQANEFNQTQEREAPKTLLDMDLIQTTLGNAIVRMEAVAEEQLRSSQALRKVDPIIDFDLVKPNCPWRWDEPHAKERIAFCEQCGAHVYNFEGLQMPEALKLIYQRENVEKPKLFKREDGKFMTRDCPVALKKAATPLLIAGVCFLVVALILFVYLLMPKPVTPVAEESNSQSQSSTSTSTKSDTNTSSQSSGNTQTQSGSNSNSGAQSSSGEVIHTKVYDHNPSNGANSFKVNSAAPSK